MAEAGDTCTIEVPGIPRKLLPILDRRARAFGSTREGYIRRLIEEDLSAGHAQSELDKILAPVHAETAAEGAAEDEIAGFFEEVRDRAWRERHSKDEPGVQRQRA